MSNQVVEKKNNVEAEKPIAPPSNLERTTSIDNEPKTLLQEELNLVREEALKVINTHPKMEALKIFLKGLKPVTISTQPSENDVKYDDEDEDEYNYEYDDEDEYELDDEVNDYDE
ncbi:unnamed protein product [Lathyrus sativus]|nr:unnamed protein product [Lathyrus sativus]